MLPLARASVEQEAHDGDGNRLFRFHAVKRPSERDEFVVGQVVRLEPGLPPPQFLAWVGVLAPQSEARCRAVPQHGLASVRSGEGALARHRTLRSIRHRPIPSWSVGRDRRVADAPLGNV